MLRTGSIQVPGAKVTEHVLHPSGNLEASTPRGKTTTRGTHHHRLSKVERQQCTVVAATAP